ncbi:amidohydrolase [Paeniglutamicibacter kerguelensis]|uniref:Peptidase M20 domain-containing protein 2 n=1 Tax=Paeniglutamicibacter kerguelensis TaxID=254788 RepID=A0ABS4XIW4_9MICC|nr:amidohydrolase [Paeniglutamicibacter kerguelensis]MBP2388402.1 amidohydrolase [Paeniglutamicibacter kerguelensis]
MNADPHAVKRHLDKRISLVHNDAVSLSHRIHSNPEIGFEEEKASRWMSEALDGAGYTVESGICGLPTAFRASIGTGDLNIALLAEYDALPGMGHACGHNLIAATAFAAAAALAPFVDELGITLTVLGTPAEERLAAGGKLLMLERGGFDGIHAALMVHPTPFEVAAPQMIAASRLQVEMTGVAAHASAAPEQGRNAADALTVAQVALGLLRQHIGKEDRISGYTTHGGEAPNIIPARTTADYVLRSTNVAQLAELENRVKSCFEGGARATGCSHGFSGGGRNYAELRSDPVLAGLYRENAEALGRDFSHDPNMNGFLASSDVGNVSQVMPTIQPFIGLGTWPVVNHQPEFTAACATPIADSSVADGAQALAATIADAASQKSVRESLLGKTPALAEGRG